MEEWLQSQGWVIGFAASAFIVITGWNYYRLFVEFPSEETWIATFGHRQHLIYNELTPEDIGVGKLFIHPQFITETMNLYAYFLEVEKLGVSDAVLDHPHYSIVDLKAQKPQFKPGTSILIMPYDYEDLMKEMFPGIEIKVLMNPRNIPQAVMGKVKTAEPAGQ